MPLKLKPTYLELSSDEYFEVFDKTMWTVVVVVVVAAAVVVCLGMVVFSVTTNGGVSGGYDLFKYLLCRNLPEEIE